MIKITRAIAAISSAALFLAVTGIAGASNLAPETETRVTPHQELMAFLMREPADPDRLAGKRIAMIAVNGADAVTLQLARDYLVEQGATVDVLTSHGQAEPAGRDAETRAVAFVKARDYAGNERLIAATSFLDESDPRAYAVIYLPGSHPDAQDLEGNAEIARYVAQATNAGKPIFAMGDASLLLAKGNLLRGGHATAARTVQPFLVWSGVDVYDEPVVRDDLIYTSRDAFDLPRLMSVMMQVLTTP
jgi:protease I